MILLNFLTKQVKSHIRVGLGFGFFFLFFNFSFGGGSSWGGFNDESRWIGQESFRFFEPAVLDISEDDIRARFMSGVNNIAAVSLNIGYPTIASAPHSIANGLKKLIAVAAATEITFPAAEKTKAFLADPSAFAVAAAPAAAAAEAKVEEKKEESADESDSSMVFDYSIALKNCTF
jgi:hypothetical protein